MVVKMENDDSEDDRKDDRKDDRQGRARRFFYNENSNRPREQQHLYITAQTLLNAVLVIVCSAGIIGAINLAILLSSVQTQVKNNSEGLASLSVYVHDEVNKGREAIERGLETRAKVESLIQEFDLDQYLRWKADPRNQNRQ